MGVTVPETVCVALGEPIGVCVPTPLAISTRVGVLVRTVVSRRVLVGTGVGWRVLVGTEVGGVVLVGIGLGAGVVGVWLGCTMIVPCIAALCTVQK